MDLNAHVGEIVASDYRSAKVFKKYGIDFCCGGGKTIDAVCEKQGINKEAILAELKTIVEANNSLETDYNKWSLSKLVTHIVEKHHAYVQEALPALDQYLNKVARVHGEHNPELIPILSHFESVKRELTQHMHKEEMILFPYIKKMEECKKQNQQLSIPPFGSIENPINMMEEEHDDAGNEMKEIRNLSNNYNPPAHACNTYMVSFKLLEEFEEDLHMHIHLENNILFPKAIQLEKKLLP